MTNTFKPDPKGRKTLDSLKLVNYCIKMRPEASQRGFSVIKVYLLIYSCVEIEERHVP